MQIQYINPFTRHPLLLSEDGLTENDKIVFPYVKGAYRVVADNNYTESFGFQWNKFTATQIDKKANLDISKTRFFAETGWDKEDLTGKKILEVGSGAGRFSQIILDFTGAELYSVDYSTAVEANFKNNGSNSRLKLFQASIYELPFAPAQFDKVFCLGVLQHTPDVERSVKALIEMVKPGGELVVDFYPYKGWWTKLQAKYLLRGFTKKMDHNKLYRLIDNHIDWLIKTSRFFSKIKLNKVNRFLPICDIDGTLPKGLPYTQLRDMCVLDTFDMFSPEYDQPQKINTIINWFKKYNMENVWGGEIKYDNCKAAVVRGIRSNTNKTN
jgi:2-polyprenyl-3-methyl-5-hydroxy-6-metoxy-1,4-benzoquinol methylase